MELFVPAELVGFLTSYEEYEPLYKAMPDAATMSRSNFFREVVVLLEHRGLLDATFAERVMRTRPMRSAEIERVLLGEASKRVVLRVQDDVSEHDLQRILETVMRMTADVVVEVMSSRR